MNQRTSLKIILVIAIAGILFSGYLSFNELFKGICPLGCTSVFNLPACVYGLIMYLIVFIISLLGLNSKK
jgi:uncharacterized membrane protein